MNLNEFVNSLKQSKVFSVKQCLVIDNIIIYFNDLKVYKVIVAVNQNMLKKAKKLGIYSQYCTTFFDDIPIKIPDNNKVEKGRFLILYNPNNSNYSIYPGEITEDEQIEKIKNSKRGKF